MGVVVESFVFLSFYFDGDVYPMRVKSPEMCMACHYINDGLTVV